MYRFIYLKLSIPIGRFQYTDSWVALTIQLSNSEVKASDMCKLLEYMCFHETHVFYYMSTWIREPTMYVRVEVKKKRRYIKIDDIQNLTFRKFVKKGANKYSFGEHFLL